MKHPNSIQLIEDRQISTLWDADQEKWYISIIDALTNSDRPRKYWSDLKTKLKNEVNCPKISDS